MSNDPLIDLDPDGTKQINWAVKLPGRPEERKIANVLEAAREHLKRVAGSATYGHEFKYVVQAVEQLATPRSPPRKYVSIVLMCRFKGIPSDECRKMLAEAKMLEDAKKEAEMKGFFDFGNPLDKAQA